MEPLVTVIIPTFNRENTILRAVNSVLQQTYDNLEVIIVDDCSNDLTAEKVNGCKDPRIRLISLPNNQGANAARNRGIEKARGTYIAFQDSDDEWAAHKLEKQIDYMIENNLEACFCPYLLQEEEKQRLMPDDYRNLERYREHIIETLRHGNCVGTPTLMVKREVFSQIGMFDEKMKRLQDYELVIRLVKKFRLGYVEEPLVKAYREQQSISSNHEALLEAQLYLLEKHLDFLDITSFLYHYFDDSDTLKNGEDREIKWEAFNRVLGIIRKKKDADLERYCYQTAMQYLYDQYDMMREALKNWYEFFKRHIRNREFAIYGAGVYGQKAYAHLMQEGYMPACFLVTEKTEKRNIDGIPIIVLSEKVKQDIPIIIAVSWERQKELTENLLNRNMYRFCVYPFC